MEPELHHRWSGRTRLAATLILLATGLSVMAEPPDPDLLPDETLPSSPQSQAYSESFNAAASSIAGAVGTVSKELSDAVAGTDRGPLGPQRSRGFEALDPQAACHLLYREVSALEPQTRSGRPDFLDSPVNAIATAVGLVHTEAFYIWLLPEQARFREGRHMHNVGLRIQELRQALAERQCFVR